MKEYASDFPFHPEKWIVATRYMTREERGDYIDLLCFQWNYDGLPENLDEIARLIGLKNGKKLSKNLIEKFPIIEGKRRNIRLEQERDSQTARIEKCRQKIEAMNAARGSTREAKQPSTRGSTRTSTRPSSILNTQSSSTPSLDKSKEVNTPISPKCPPEVSQIIEHLNKCAGTGYRRSDGNIEIITARLKEEGVTLDGVLEMIEHRCFLWKDDPQMEQYLRPATLFGKKKFDGYYGSVPREAPPPDPTQEDDAPPEGPTDMDDIRSAIAEAREEQRKIDAGECELELVSEE